MSVRLLDLTSVGQAKARWASEIQPRTQSPREPAPAPTITMLSCGVATIGAEGSHCGGLDFTHLSQPSGYATALILCFLYAANRQSFTLPLSRPSYSRPPLIHGNLTSCRFVSPPTINHASTVL